MTNRTCTVGVLALCFFGLAGCEENKSETKPATDAAAQEGPAVDPSLAEAMKAASSKKKGSRSGAEAEPGKGPPPTGIFERGGADAEMAKGAAPKITLGSEGTEPRVKLAAAPPAAGWKRAGSIELSIRAGRNALPPINAELAFEAVKPKAAKPGEAAPAAPANGGMPIVVKVTKASVPPSPGGSVAELDKAVAKMKGSRMGFRFLPSGASDDFSVDLAKDAGKDLDALLRPLSEVLAAVTMPFPDKAVGKGAYWMVTSRETVMGVDVVSYRMVRVEEVTGDAATLALTIKRYAANADLNLPGVPPDAKLEQFQSVAEGQLTVSAGASLLPASGNLRQNLVAMLTPPAGTDPSQRLTAQTASEATLKFPVAAKPAPKPASE